LGQVTLHENKAKLFNDYFFSIFLHSSYQLPLLHKIAHITPALAEINSDERKAYTALTSLECSKATDIDGIHPDVLNILLLCLPNLSITYLAKS